MTIRLPEDLEKQIREQVAAGMAATVQEFVEGAVRHALDSKRAGPTAPARRSAAEVFDEIWGDASDEALRRLPDDGAEQVDHYVYGLPKR